MKTTILSSVLAAVRSGPIPAVDPSAEPGLEAPAVLTADENASVLATASETVREAIAGAVANVPAASVSADASFQAGYQAATDRFAAVLASEGIAGDGRRMKAAMDLALSSPTMSAEAVAAFITANVAGATAPAAPSNQPAASYEERRIHAAALTTPQASTAKADAPSGLNPSAVFAKRRALNAK